jgi:LCP family protein required for cell wall assembly
VVLLVVVVVGGTSSYLYVRLHSIARVKVKVTPVPKTGVENILLVGSTSRCAVAPAKSFQNFVEQCEDGVNGVNSDVIMILRLVPGRTPMLLSIPRDTFVPDAREGDLSNKVDAALADGPDQLVQAIEEDFGIPINHYVVLNFQTFANIVTALGGITMYFPTTLLDKQSGLDISHSGCVHISGLEALALVRSRHLYYDYDRRTHQWLGYDGSGDIGRIERVHVFLKVLGEEIASRGVGNPVTDNALLSAIAPDLTLDTTFGSKELVDLILDYHSKVDATDEFTLPIVEDTQEYLYKGYDYGDVVFPTAPIDQETIDTFLGGSPVGAQVKPASVSVSVSDGTGSPTGAAQMITSLHALGFKVTAAPPVTPVGPVSETTVVYNGPTHLAQAERVLNALTGLAVLSDAPTAGGADVTVVTGSDVGVAAPGAVPVLSASTGATATTTLGAVLTDLLLAGASATSASTVESVLAPATTAEPPIAAYDPRACPAK